MGTSGIPDMDPLPKVAIYGGAFNPVHEGHLSLARELQKRFSLSKILFVPTGRPPHKSLSGDPGAAHRFGMLEKAISGNKGWEAVPIEINRSGISYTVQTLRDLALLERPWLILGTDAFQTFLSWKDPVEILKQADLLVASRPGTSFEEIAPVVSGVFSLLGKERLTVSSDDVRLLDSGLLEFWMRSVQEVPFRLALVRVDTPDISSTMVRGVLSGFEQFT